MKRFSIAPGRTVAEVTQQHQKWFRALEPSDRERLNKDIDDLISNGTLLFDQGGSFQSKRNLNLNNEAVTLIADFRQPSFLRKLLQAIGFK